MGAYENGSFHFKVVKCSPQPSDGGAELSWNSREGDTYTVESSSNLSAWTLEDVVASQGKQTSWKDSGATSKRKYYRIGLE